MRFNKLRIRYSGELPLQVLSILIRMRKAFLGLQSE